MDYLDRLDAWLEGEDEGQRPEDVLRERGIDVPDETNMNDEQLSAALWRVLSALTEIGVIISYTDHLTDRALYRRLVEDVLSEPAFLMPDDPGSFHCYDMVGDGGEDDNATFLSYYATDEERADWIKDFPDPPLPPKKAKVADRDRLLATVESRVALLEPAQ